MLKHKSDHCCLLDGLCGREFSRAVSDSNFYHGCVITWGTWQMCVKPVIHGHTSQSILRREARRYEDLQRFRITVVKGVVAFVLVVEVVIFVVVVIVVVGV